MLFCGMWTEGTESAAAATRPLQRTSCARAQRPWPKACSLAIVIMRPAVVACEATSTQVR